MIKLKQKIGIGLVLTSIISAIWIFTPIQAAAAPVTNDDFANSTYQVISIPKDDTGTSYPDLVEVSVTGVRLSFNDIDPSDPTHQLKFYGSTFVCGGASISIDGPGQALPDNSGASWSAKLDLDYVASNNLQCQHEIKIRDMAITLVYTGQLPDDIPPNGGGGGGGVTPPGSVTGSEEACYASGWSLGWLACPMIRAASDTANAMYTFVEGQLTFRVPKDLGGEAGSVKKAWNEFRVLVSALVVILLLVMVISQAIGTGPFDAYTVRKMLPRVVAGVILIQISWPIFEWVINTVDDLGRGLADIMYAPFGGSSKMDLFSLLSPQGIATKAVVFNWVGLGAFVIFGIVAPFIILGMLLTVLVALFAGFLTLLFRKVLIILALIFVPLALISWMMPNEGLRKYWKLWWDNFIKALMMFPLIIVIIAAGRIFAKIGGPVPNDFVSFFIVLVGFFGPLFILPKTFKWGGTAMAFAGEKISKAQERGLKRPKEFLGERQKGYSEERNRQSRERFAHDEGVELNKKWKKGFGVPSLWRRPIDLTKSGKLDPTLWRRRSRQAQDSYVFKGVESEESDVKNANARAQLVINSLHSDEQDDYGKELARGRKFKTKDGRILATRDDNPTSKTFGQLLKDRKGRLIPFEVGPGEEGEFTKSTGLEMRAGLDQLVRLGGDGNIDQIQKISEEIMASRDVNQIEQLNKFTTANVGNLFNKLPHIYKNASSSDPSHRDYASFGRTIDGLKPEDITQLAGPGMERMLEVLGTRSTDASATLEQRAKAAAERGKLLGVYDEAYADVTLRGRIPSAVRVAVDSARGAPPPAAGAGGPAGGLSPPPTASGGTSWRPTGGSSTPI